MFAALADVRNMDDIEHLPIRGLPEDACPETMECYGEPVVDKFKDVYQEDCCVLASRAEEWVKKGFSYFYKVGGVRYCSDPDAHTPSWCTTQEMEDCINRVFKDKSGEWKPTAQPYEWLALLGAMKGYESTGEYECRAVFWFDN